jgi:hypothetical protein
VAELGDLLEGEARGVLGDWPRAVARLEEEVSQSSHWGDPTVREPGSAVWKRGRGAVEHGEELERCVGGVARETAAFQEAAHLVVGPEDAAAGIRQGAGAKRAGGAAAQAKQSNGESRQRRQRQDWPGDRMILEEEA